MGKIHAAHVPYSTAPSADGKLNGCLYVCSIRILCLLFVQRDTRYLSVPRRIAQIAVQIESRFADSLLLCRIRNLCKFNFPLCLYLRSFYRITIFSSLLYLFEERNVSIRLLSYNQFK